jgi:predicted transcriptional regulator
MSSEPQRFKPDLYVIARIIKVLKEKENLNKTALATYSGLSYDKFMKYLTWLLEKRFVRIENDGSVILTKEGAETYDELVQWIMKNIGQLKFPRLRFKA